MLQSLEFRRLVMPVIKTFTWAHYRKMKKILGIDCLMKAPYISSCYCRPMGMVK